MESPGKFLNTQCVIRLIRTSYILSPLFLLWRKSFLFAFASESCLSDYNAKLTDHLYVQRWENNFIVAIYFLKKKFVAFKMQQLNNTWMMYFLLLYVVSLYPLFSDNIKCRRVFNLYRSYAIFHNISIISFLPSAIAHWTILNKEKQCLFNLEFFKGVDCLEFSLALIGFHQKGDFENCNIIPTHVLIPKKRSRFCQKVKHVYENNPTYVPRSSWLPANSKVSVSNVVNICSEYQNSNRVQKIARVHFLYKKP